MVDYGIVLGLLGVASGAASLIYSRSQVVAARRQAEQATRATLLESNREISVRLQQIRSRFFKTLLEGKSVRDPMVSTGNTNATRLNRLRRTRSNEKKSSTRLDDLQANRC